MRSARRRTSSPWRPPPGRAAARRDAMPTAIPHRRRRLRSGIPDGIRGPRLASLLDGRRHLRRVLDGLADARIGAAAANVPRHRLVDIGIGGSRYLHEQRTGGHDLPGLTVAALHDLEIEPGLLDLLARRGVAAGLDGSDGMADGGAHRHHAGSPGDAIQVHGAGAAQRGAAAELGAVHAEQVAQGPEKRPVRFPGYLVRLAVDVQSDHRLASESSFMLLSFARDPLADIGRATEQLGALLLAPPGPGRRGEWSTASDPSRARS